MYIDIVVHAETDIKKSWNYAIAGSRGDLAEVIVEEFIPFDTEVTLLTVTHKERSNTIPSTNRPSAGTRRLSGKLDASSNV